MGAELNAKTQGRKDARDIGSLASWRPGDLALSEGFRDTPLGPLPETWEVILLGDIARLHLGRTPKREKVARYWTDGVVPWVSVRDLNNSVVTETAEKISRQAFEEVFGNKAVSKESLLLSFKLTIGKVGVLGVDAVHNEAIASLTLTDNVERDFLFFMLQHIDYDNYLDTYLKGKTLNKGKLSILPIPLPPLPEQRAIAHALWTVQQAREATERVIAAARELKRSLMRHLFTYGAVPVTQADQVELRETEIGHIPAHWGVVQLEDWADLVTKGSSPKWQGFDYCEDGIVFVRSQNVGAGVLDLSEVAYLPNEFNELQKRSILQEGDLLVNIVGASIGRAALADARVEGANVNQAVAVVRLKQGIDTQFVMNFLFTEAGQVQIHRQKKEIARANISLQDINNFLLPLPPVSEQHEIARTLATADAKIAAEEGRRGALEALFHSLLYHLMTGKIRTQGRKDAKTQSKT